MEEIKIEWPNVSFSLFDHLTFHLPAFANAEGQSGDLEHFWVFGGDVMFGIVWCFSCGESRESQCIVVKPLWFSFAFVEHTFLRSF